DCALGPSARRSRASADRERGRANRSGYSTQSLTAALLAVGEFGRPLERSKETEQLAEAAGDFSRLVRARALVSNTPAHIGRTEEAVRTARDAVDVASSLQDPALKGFVTHYMGHALQ